MSKIIVITSGKGGVGKTTTSINLGAAMNFFGEDVLIIDGNLTTPNIGLHLNSPEVPINLNHVLANKAEVFEAIYEHESGLKILPASLSVKELTQIKPERIKNFKKEFKKMSNYIIVDCAAGLADELIVVTNPEVPAITDALKTIKLAEHLNIPVMGVIITRVKKNRIEMQPDTVKEMLETPILGMIPEDLAVAESLNYKDAVIHTSPKSNASRAYKEIAAQIIGAHYDSNKDKEKMYLIILRRLGLIR